MKFNSKSAALNLRVVKGIPWIWAAVGAFVMWVALGIFAHNLNLESLIATEHERFLPCDRRARSNVGHHDWWRSNRPFHPECNHAIGFSLRWHRFGQRSESIVSRPGCSPDRRVHRACECIHRALPAHTADHRNPRDRLHHNDGDLDLQCSFHDGLRCSRSAPYCARSAFRRGPAGAAHHDRDCHSAQPDANADSLWEMPDRGGPESRCGKTHRYAGEPGPEASPTSYAVRLQRSAGS